MRASACAITVLAAAALLLSACEPEGQPSMLPTRAEGKPGTAALTPTTAAPGPKASTTWLTPSPHSGADAATAAGKREPPGLPGIPTTFPDEATCRRRGGDQEAWRHRHRDEGTRRREVTAPLPRHTEQQPHRPAMHAVRGSPAVACATACPHPSRPRRATRPERAAATMWSGVQRHSGVAPVTSSPPARHASATNSEQISHASPKSGTKHPSGSWPSSASAIRTSCAQSYRTPSDARTHASARSRPGRAPPPPHTSPP